MFPICNCLDFSVNATEPKGAGPDDRRSDGQPHVQRRQPLRSVGHLRALFVGESRQIPINAVNF